MTRKITTLLALSLTASLLLAQEKDKEPDPTLTIGDTPAPVQVSHWLKGPKFSRKKPPETFVITFIDADEKGAALLQEVGRITKDYKSSKIKALAVLPPIEKKPIADARAWVKANTKGLSVTVGLDKEGRTRKAWMEAMQAKAVPHSAIVHDGKIAWEGRPEDVLHDNVGEVLAGRLDLGLHWILRNRNQANVIGRAMMSRKHEELIGLVDERLKKFPESVNFYGLKFRAISRMKDGKAKSLAFFEQGIETLAKTNQYAAISFAESVNSLSRSPEVIEAAMTAMHGLSGAEARYPGKAVALQIKILDQQGKNQDALALAKKAFERFKASAADLRALSGSLGNSKKVAVYKDVLRPILEARIPLETDPIYKDGALYLHWQIVAWLYDDAETTMAITKRALEQLSRPDPMNGVLWDILTEKKFGDEYLDLAMTGTERMLAMKGLGPNQLDTAALACWKKGDKKRAITLQERALKAAKADEYPDEDLIQEFEKKLLKYKK